MIVIVVLGRKLNPDGTPSDILRTRMEDAVIWYNYLSRFSETTLLLSGGSSFQRNSKLLLRSILKPFGNQTEASLMVKMATNLGVPRKNIIVEDSSSNTLENARFSKEILDSIDYKELYLLTSDFHMPRAGYIFKTVVDKEISPLVSRWDNDFEKDRENAELEKLNL